MRKLASLGLVLLALVAGCETAKNARATIDLTNMTATCDSDATVSVDGAAVAQLVQSASERSTLRTIALMSDDPTTQQRALAALAATEEEEKGDTVDMCVGTNPDGSCYAATGSNCPRSIGTAG